MIFLKSRAPAFIMAAFALCLLVAPVRAEQLARVYAPDGIALSGYDAVAYFTQGRPVRGQPEFSLRWHGAMWYFSTPEALMHFEMNPAAYAPQFGGYCTYSVSLGDPKSGAPDAFFLQDGRLFLLHRAALLQELHGQLSKIVARARYNWPEVLGR
jgi:YHS domain-containing protein